MRIELQPAFLLHSRNYRDTSVIADLWTPEYGRLSVLAKGARRRKGGKKHLLVPFTPLLISCRGKGELKTLTHIELAAKSVSLQQTMLFSGFYLNELLLRLLPIADPHALLFSRYGEIIESLQQDIELEPCLRQFEWFLLQQLGYELNFSIDALLQQPVIASQHYQLDVNRGFVACGEGGYQGANLLAIAAADYSLTTTRQVAKQVARQALQALLGSKPLNSREMYRQMHV